MKVSFRTNRLRKCFEQQKSGVREWGDVMATNYIRRIKAIQAAACFDDLPKLPQLNFHPLTGDKRGEYAVNLTGRARIILKKKMEDGHEIAEICDVDLTHYGD